MTDNRVKEIAMEKAPAVYCGTYAKYNGGSLQGEWVKLTDFDSYDEFIEYCKKLHSDEDDPELMFQDYEYFPDAFYTESCMGEETFNKIIEYANHYDRDALEAFIDLYGTDMMDRFDDMYEGEWDSEEDFAWHIFRECYEGEMSDFALRYFDIDMFTRDLFYEYDFEDGYVFRNF